MGSKLDTSLYKKKIVSEGNLPVTGEKRAEFQKSAKTKQQIE